MRAKTSYLKKYGLKIAARDGGFFCHYCGCKLVPLPYVDHPEACTLVERDGEYWYSHNAGYTWAEVDHVMPRCRGGSNDLSNLVISCGRCNNSKSGSTPQEWLARLSARAGAE